MNTTTRPEAQTTVKYTSSSHPHLSSTLAHPPVRNTSSSHPHLSGRVARLVYLSGTLAHPPVKYTSSSHPPVKNTSSSHPHRSGRVARLVHLSGTLAHPPVRYGSLSHVWTLCCVLTSMRCYCPCSFNTCSFISVWTFSRKPSTTRSPTDFCCRSCQCTFVI